MNSLEFSDFDSCERCGERKALCRTGVCQECLDQMRALGKCDASRVARLKALSKSETGIVQSIRSRMLLETRQQPPEGERGFNRMFKRRDQQRLAGVLSRKRFEAIFQATPQELTDARPDDHLRPQLLELNGELVRWLAKKPSLMRELSPRKFEEVVAEILGDQGHTVQLTPATRDGGRDIIVEMQTPLGVMLVIIECKRWLPPNKVGLSVVERFLYVIREKSKANSGIIATTTTFSADARKSAREYKYQLRLADFNQLHEMAKRYGTWHQKEGHGVWVPDYATL